MKPRKFIRDHPSITLTILVGLLGVTIYSCFTNFVLRRKLSRYQPETTTVAKVTTSTEEGNYNTDIKITDTPFTKIDPYKGSTVPATILFWGTDSVRAAASDSHISPESPPFDHNGSGFPLGQPGIGLTIGSPLFGLRQDSLVQLLLDRNNMELSFYDRKIRKYYSSKYNLDLERYKYNWTSESGLTQAKDRYLKIGPYVQGRYQVFNKTFQVSSGISFETRKWEYDLGLSMSHDPLFNQKVRPDLEISVKYKFNRWLK